MENSLGILKPDCLRRGLEKEILSIIETSGLKITERQKRYLSEEEVKIIWSTCAKEWFFPQLIEFMRSSEVVIFVVEAVDTIRVFNDLVGSSDPSKAEKNTIRYKYGISKKENTIHSSLDQKEYAKEHNLLFVQKL